MYNLFKFLVLIFSIFTVFFGLNMSVDAAQKSYDYRMPFRAGEIWKNDMDHGVHTDKTGYGIDFYPTSPSSWEVLAPADGVITRGCTVNDVTFLTLQTNLGDAFRFVHLDANTVPIQKGFQKEVVRGETLGKINTSKIAEDSTCFLTSELPHIHFSFLKEMCPLQIDGYTFTCDDMKDCGNANIYSVKCNQIYLGEEFKSTNVPVNPNSVTVEDNYCDNLKNSNFKYGDNNPIVIGLQKCLKKVGMFDWAGGFTGLFGKYTESKFNEWKNSSKPVVAQAQANIDTCDNLKNASFKFGDSGDQIIELQKCLQSAGLFNWPDGFTGYYGKYTESKFNEWKNTSKSVEIQIQATNSPTKNATPEECKDLPYQKWYMTQKGSEVVKLQNCLKTMGYFNHSAGSTGYFGNVTKIAYSSWTEDITNGRR